MKNKPCVGTIATNVYASTGGLSQLHVSRFASLHPTVRAALLKHLLELTCAYHKAILGYV